MTSTLLNGRLSCGIGVIPSLCDQTAFHGHRSSKLFFQTKDTSGKRLHPWTADLIMAVITSIQELESKLGGPAIHAEQPVEAS